MRFATDDRVTVTDPAHWHYGRKGIVTEGAWEGWGDLYGVTFDDGRIASFSADQLDFTEEAPKA